ncbi:hypothetical protein [Hyphococcus luteus]|uniref:Uncharacterized protein n=1 Tax=Hyphococcus luteus TaxID=2058213 RepID=A0A2S7K768_9PROT|nr:hypothetical protein [Marinicaulis flavus]PQA88365.1 hypothetical protein CW354_08695 [Marinicaulis flavus]
MDTIEFILILAVFAVVLHWYLKNARAKSDGLLGLLALKDDPEIDARPRRKAYRLKPRARTRAADLRDSRTEDAAPKTYRTLDEGERMRRRYRRQDEARYRVKDKAARYKPGD